MNLNWQPLLAFCSHRFNFTEKSQNGRQKETRLAPKQMELRVVGLFPNSAFKKKHKPTHPQVSGACALKRAVQQLSRRFSVECGAAAAPRGGCPCRMRKEVPETLNLSQSPTCPLRRRQVPPSSLRTHSGRG